MNNNIRILALRATDNHGNGIPGYVLTEGNFGRLVDDGRIYPNKAKAYKEAAWLWPLESWWFGRKAHRGYLIRWDK